MTEGSHPLEGDLRIWRSYNNGMLVRSVVYVLYFDDDEAVGRAWWHGLVLAVDGEPLHIIDGIGCSFALTSGQAMLDELVSEGTDDR